MVLVKLFGPTKGNDMSTLGMTDVKYSDEKLRRTGEYAVEKLSKIQDQLETQRAKIVSYKLVKKEDLASRDESLESIDEAIKTIEYLKPMRSETLDEAKRRVFVLVRDGRDLEDVIIDFKLQLGENLKNEKLVNAEVSDLVTKLMGINKSKEALEVLRYHRDPKFIEKMTKMINDKRSQT